MGDSVQCVAGRFQFVMTMMSLTLDEMLESFLFTTLRSIFEPYTFG